MVKVLVTGGAGFIGSHIVDLLVTEGYQVAVLDNLSTGNLRNLNPKVELYKVDLTDFSGVKEVLAQYRPDYVIHHAAQVDVMTSLQDPVQDGTINILGSLNLFREAFQMGVKKVIYASSAAIYGDPGDTQPLPLSEGIPIYPLSPYGISKYTPEHYLRIAATAAEASYAVLRYANVYGPRQNATGEGGVVAIFSHLISQKQPVTIYGDGEQTRDFVYVSDVARANLAALRAEENGIFNVSTGRRVSVNELLALLQEIAGVSTVCHHLPLRPGEILHSALDPRKAKEKLGWKAQTNFSQGLQQTYNYFLQLVLEEGA